MAQSNTPEKPWIDFEQFFDFALKYHEKEPIVANIIAMSVPAIAIIWMLLRHQDKKMKIQVEDNKNIRNFDYKLAKLKNKHKGKGGRDE